MDLTLLTLSIFGLLETSTHSFKLGENFDPVRYQATPKVAPLTRGSFDDLPSSISLLAYAPKVGNQKNSGSCVGWASSYSAASVAWSITAEKSNQNFEDPVPFSPSFVFNRIKVSKDCEGGSNIESALSDLTINGSLSLADFPYSDVQCERLPTDFEFDLASMYSIEGYRRLSSVYSTRSLHVATRRALEQRHPVVIGMLVGPSFINYKAAYSTLRISVEENALYDKVGIDGMYGLEGYGGHAMTVVGYDDDRDGGAFHIMNSWGTSWGDKGFAWVKYSDFIRWVRSAYEVIPQIPEVQERDTPDFNAEVSLMGFRQKNLPLKQTDVGFNLESPLHSGSNIRAEINVSADSYVYILGTDDVTEHHIVLFPKKGEVSPLLTAGNTILLPGPTEDFYIRLDDTAGTDYLIVLHSRDKLDVNKLAQRMNTYKSRALIERLQTASDGRLVPLDKTKSGKSGLYEATLGNKGLLATIITIDHQESLNNDIDKKPPQIVIVSPEVENTDAFLDGDDIVLYVTGDEAFIKGIAQDESDIKNLVITNSFDIKFSSRGPFVARVDLRDTVLGSSKKINVQSTDKYNNKSSKTITIFRVQP